MYPDAQPNGMSPSPPQPHHRYFATTPPPPVLAAHPFAPASPSSDGVPPLIEDDFEEDRISDADDAPAMPSSRLPCPMDHVSEADKEKAAAELKEAGLDCGSLDGMIRHSREMGVAVAAELRGLLQRQEQTSAMHKLYHQALRAMREAMENAALPLAQASKLADSEKSLVAALRDHKREMEDEASAELLLNAKLAVIQSLGRQKNETSCLPLCPICFDAPVAMAAHRCGHTFCEHCLAHAIANDQHCFICRAVCTEGLALRFS